ncbi:hypothetical protein glysoja_026983 [Glycine soja]|uniref:Uncharacterized protein n=1 Tax=Glycine soja TaxID=3848 RepID=A0A0B2Q850_GLYSO|nr:hypothetical protein glysoja_026983 [Glycine soja]
MASLVIDVPSQAHWITQLTKYTGLLSLHTKYDFWGCWNASEELKNPSVRIIFPTIERVKNAYNGILPSRYILCFTEKTWQRLKTSNILHDAIPHTHERIGHPMHIKVMRRCSWSGRDAPSIATNQALREVMVELAEREKEKHTEEEMKDENDEEEYVELPEELEATNYVEQEKEDEKAYADILWSQVDSFQSS